MRKPLLVFMLAQLAMSCGDANEQMPVNSTSKNLRETAHPQGGRLEKNLIHLSTLESTNREDLHQYTQVITQRELSAEDLLQISYPPAFTDSPTLLYEVNRRHFRADGSTSGQKAIYETINPSPNESCTLPKIDQSSHTFENGDYFIIPRTRLSHNLSSISLQGIQNKEHVRRQRDQIKSNWRTLARNSINQELARNNIDATLVGLEYISQQPLLLKATLTAEQARRLSQSEQISGIHKTDKSRKEIEFFGCDPNVSDPGQLSPPEWHIGHTLIPERIDAERFIQNGYSGERGNSARHNYNDITVGIIDGFGTLGGDEPCYMADLSACQNSRIRKKYECLSPTYSWPYCSEVTSWQSGTDGVHGHSVMSVIAGDYTDDQGRCLELDDPSYIPGSCSNSSGDHCSWWENKSSGIAREASVIIGSLHEKSPNKENDAFSHMLAMTDDHVDILNISWGFPGGQCDISTQGVLEYASEMAYMDGVFVVAAAGNTHRYPNEPNAPDTSAPCDIPNGLQDRPMVFTVNGLYIDDVNCRLDYEDCRFGVGTYGGGDANINGVLRNNVLSIIDLIAPTRHYLGVSTMSPDLVPEGGMRGNWFGGTSAAVPTVAGAAALVKDWLLSKGEDWVNSPGRLHAVMLAMGDRYKGDNTRAVTYIDDIHGAGRLKLRQLDDASFGDTQMIMVNIPIGPNTTSNPPKFLLSSFPMPTGTRFLKCAMWESVATYGETEFSDITLRVNLKPATGALGTCSTSATTLESKWSGSFDFKHLVAFESPENVLGGRCAEIQVDNYGTTSAGANASVFCYSSEVKDYENVP